MGIGTSNPLYQLNVQVGGRPWINIESTAPGEVASLRLKSLTGEWHHSAEVDGGLSFWSGGRYVLYLTNDGNVGIGTTAPTEKLVVNQGSVSVLPTGPFPMTLLSGTNGQASGYVEMINAGAFGVQLRGNEVVALGVGTTERMRINSQGNVGIGTSTPSQKLDVAGNINVTGDAFKPGGGSWSVASDRRFKKNITPLEEALEHLLALHGVAFEWKDPAKNGGDRRQQIGVIAQEVERVFPQWVSTKPDGTKYVTFRGFEALTVEAMRELKKGNDSLKAQNDALKQEVVSLRQAFGDHLVSMERRLARLETRPAGRRLAALRTAP